MLLKTSCLAEVNPLLPIPLLDSFSYIDFPYDDNPTITSLSSALNSIMFSLFSLAITVLSTIIVFVISPTSAVSPPAE